MSKKYILNKTNSVLTLHDNKLATIVKLQPRQCSFQTFEEAELMSSPYVYKTYLNGFIDLLDEHVEVVKKTNNKNYGQTYKIGTLAYLNDKNNLDIEVLSYNPNSQLYTVKIVRTGGTIAVQEKSITLKKNMGDSINVDIDENGDLVDSKEITTHKDLSLPQEPEQVQIVRTQDQSVNRAINAKQLIDDQNALAEKIANQKVDIVYSNEEKQEKVDDEEIFIVKSPSGKFAKEITSSEMVENTKQAINDTLQEVIDSTKLAKAEQKKDTIDEGAFNKLSEEMKAYINTFMTKDARSKKVVITRLKDVEKLSAIASCADTLSQKAARAKLEKILG